MTESLLLLVENLFFLLRDVLHRDRVDYFRTLGGTTIEQFLHSSINISFGWMDDGDDTPQNDEGRTRLKEERCPRMSLNPFKSITECCDTEMGISSNCTRNQNEDRSSLEQGHKDSRVVIIFSSLKGPSFRYKGPIPPPPPLLVLIVTVKSGCSAQRKIYTNKGTLRTLALPSTHSLSRLFPFSGNGMIMLAWNVVPWMEDERQEGSIFGAACRVVLLPLGS